jgi:hypothetical protein
MASDLSALRDVYVLLPDCCLTVYIFECCTEFEFVRYDLACYSAVTDLLVQQYLSSALLCTITAIIF